VYLSGIYHIATFATSLRVVPRDYSSSSKSSLHVGTGSGTCNSGCTPAACRSAFYSLVGDISGARTKTIFACDRPPSPINMQLRLRPTTTVSFWRCFKRDGPSVKLVTGSELRPKNRLTLRAVIFTPFRSNLGFAFAYEASSTPLRCAGRIYAQ